MTSRKKRKSLARIFADHRRIARTASPVLITSTARSLCFTTTHSTLTPQTEQYSESIFPNIRKTSEVLPSSRVANRFGCFRGCPHTPPGVGPPSCSMIDSPCRWISGRQRQAFSWGDPNPSLASAAPGKIPNSDREHQHPRAAKNPAIASPVRNRRRELVLPCEVRSTQNQ